MATDTSHIELKAVSFNMHDFNQGCAAIDELISNYMPDIILIQEHWLTPANLSKLDVFSSFLAFGCYAMSDTVEYVSLRATSMSIYTHQTQLPMLLIIFVVTIL